MRWPYTVILSWEKRSGLYHPTINKLRDAVSLLDGGKIFGEEALRRQGKFPKIADNMHVSCGADRVDEASMKRAN